MTDSSKVRHENKVNMRAGHVAVSHRERAIVWAGYLENPVDDDQYWNSSEVMIYNSLTQTWTCQRTTGDVPTKCSGAAATVLGDVMYVVAGFHKIVVSLKAFREENANRNDVFDSDSDDDEDNNVSSVEISNCIWALDLETFIWSKLTPSGEPPLKCDKTACWSFKDKVYIFGGFGPPPVNSQNYPSLNSIKHKSLFDFCEDPSTNSGMGHYMRGWSNQLVATTVPTTVGSGLLRQDQLQAQELLTVWLSLVTWPMSSEADIWIID